MRLINVHKALNPPQRDSYIISEDDCPIEEFNTEESIPRYAALSHRWLSSELLLKHVEAKPISAYQGVMKLRDSATKILNACQYAQQYAPNVTHLWIDTCCIDKTNAVELDEAIRSMYNWYRHAATCLVYLADVTTPSTLPSSVWFRRGWTLQELLAPPDCLFFSARWTLLGTRSHLADAITRATTIPHDALLHYDALAPRISVATKLSWAALRRTTRPEDAAYALVGLLHVPGLAVRYGEGATQAVQRLQEEIIRTSHDESIFAWQSAAPHSGGLIAPGLDCFLGLGAVQLRPEAYVYRGPYDITNGAVRFPVSASLVGGPKLDAKYQARKARNGREGILVPLYCWKLVGRTWYAVNIKIGLRGERWRRLDCHVGYLTETAAWATEPGETHKISTALVVRNL